MSLATDALRRAPAAVSGLVAELNGSMCRLAPNPRAVEPLRAESGGVACESAEATPELSFVARRIGIDYKLQNQVPDIRIQKRTWGKRIKSALKKKRTMPQSLRWGYILLLSVCGYRVGLFHC